MAQTVYPCWLYNCINRNYNSSDFKTQLKCRFLVGYTLKTKKKKKPATKHNCADMHTHTHTHTHTYCKQLPIITLLMAMQVLLFWGCCVYMVG